MKNRVAKVIIQHVKYVQNSRFFSDFCSKLQVFFKISQIPCFLATLENNYIIISNSSYLWAQWINAVKSVSFGRNFPQRHSSALAASAPPPPWRHSQNFCPWRHRFRVQLREVGVVAWTSSCTFFVDSFVVSVIKRRRTSVQFSLFSLWLKSHLRNYFCLAWRNVHYLFRTSNLAIGCLQSLSQPLCNKSCFFSINFKLCCRS